MGWCVGGCGHRPEARLRGLWAFSPGWLASLADIHSWRSGLVRRRLCRADGAAALHGTVVLQMVRVSTPVCCGPAHQEGGNQLLQSGGHGTTVPPRTLTVVRVMAQEPERREGRPAAAGAAVPGGLSARGRPLPWDRLGGGGKSCSLLCLVLQS